MEPPIKIFIFLEIFEFARGMFEGGLTNLKNILKNSIFLKNEWSLPYILMMH